MICDDSFFCMHDEGPSPVDRVLLVVEVKVRPALMSMKPAMA